MLKKRWFQSIGGRYPRLVVRKIATIGLAGAMMMSMALPTFAATGDPTTYDSTNGLPISKTLNTAAGVTKPDTTFSFTITAKDGQTGAPTVTSPQTAATYSGEGDGRAVNANIAVANIFSDVVLTNTAVGHYTYTVAESKNTYTAGDGETMVYDGSANVLLTTTTGTELYTANASGTTPTLASDGTVTGATAVNATGSATVTYGTTYYFVLGNSDHAYFKVLAGTKYTVNEVSAKGNKRGLDYTKTVAGSITSDGTQATATTGANTVSYTNAKTSNPLTGIVNNYGGLIAVVAIAAGGMVILSFRRRRDAYVSRV